jgi:hypothetical protein
MLRKYFATFGGIILGGLYGLVMRILLEIGLFDIQFSDLFSITFLVIVPMVVGLIPLKFAPNTKLEDVDYISFSPVLSVFVFFIICFVSKIEDMVCLIIISFPFLLVTGVLGLFFGKRIVRYRNKKGILYSIFFLPLLTGLVEPNFPTPNEKYETTSSILINTDKTLIWKNVIRVNNISNAEYTKGFFNYAGIPRPLFAELDKEGKYGTRIGYFEGGLKFKETIILWEDNRNVTFDIEVIPSEKYKSIFERHIIRGNHFKFINASYKLVEYDKGQTKLILSTKYELNSNINFYGKFWAKYLLSDFQERLLYVIKNRCER